MGSLHSHCVTYHSLIRKLFPPTEENTGGSRDSHINLCRFVAAEQFSRFIVLKWRIGMAVGLIIRVTPGRSIQDSVSFDYQFFFNLLLPPIILASGYELHQVNREAACK